MQDLIDSNHIQIRGMNDQGNTFVTPPNQKFQIFTNPMHNHNISFLKANETKNEVMNVDMNGDNMEQGLVKTNEENIIIRMISLIEIQPHID